MRIPVDYIEFRGFVYPARSIEIRTLDEIKEIYHNKRRDGVTRVTDLDRVEFAD